MSDYLAPAEEIIEEARVGRVFILVEDGGAGNVGMAAIPASFASAEAVTFMAVHCRGVVCLALTPGRVAQLNLPPMVAQNSSPRQSAFTVSIEAREGVSTGISAADRARTIEVAIDPQANDRDLVSPGHIFPVAARDGGVLVRAGFSEAAVDVARIAGLNPSAALCAIIGEDGELSTLDELIAFARRHDLKIGTIRDLVAYRHATEVLIERVSSETIDSEHGGEWRMHVYRNRVDGTEHCALVKGAAGAGTTLVRMHAFAVQDDVLGRKGGRAGLIPQAMEVIAAEGAGVVVLIRGPIVHKSDGSVPSRAGRDDKSALREYGVGAQILRDLGVTRIELLSGSLRAPIPGIDGYGLEVAGIRPFGRALR